MKLIFADTLFLLALVRTKDQHHRRARLWEKSISGQLLTTEYVIVEFCDACARGELRQRCPAYIRSLRANPAVTIVAASDKLVDEGLRPFESRNDKTWGLTDCISFSVMRAYRVSDALTADAHFEQAGFRALLRSDPPEEAP